MATTSYGTNSVVYLTYDLLTGTLLAELPLTGVTFGQILNGGGRFAGQLDLADSRVKNALGGTLPGRTALYVEINGSLVWGGIIWTRRYQHSTRMLDIGATEFWSYFTRRVQAKDYSTTWASPTDPLVIARTVVNDAIAVAGSALAGLSVVLDYQQTITSAAYVAPSYPIAQLQTVDSIVSTLSKMGYNVGFDFGIDVAWSAGSGSTPTQTLNLGFPRRGRIAGSTGLTIDSASDEDFSYPEDASRQATTIYGTATGSGGVQQSASSSVPTGGGYPLLEQTASFGQLNGTDVLQSCVKADNVMLGYPVPTPTVTIPVFGDPPLGAWLIGDDIRWIVPNQTAVGNVYDERFPSGADFYWRILAHDVTIKDEGLSTVTLTYGMPPSTQLIAPPT